MQPLTKALRRRLKRLAPGLRERDIDRFEEERESAMQSALLEDPLYAEALGSAPEPERRPFAAAPRPRSMRPAAAPPQSVRELAPLLLRAAEAERASLDRKADRALARQGEAARPKRALAPRAVARKPAKKTAPKKTARKAPPRKAGPKIMSRKARGRTGRGG